MSKYVPVHIAYQTFTPANGADENLSPIIFLHGMSGSKENWADIPQVITDGTNRKAYAIDARNHGDSEYTDEFNFNLNADDLFHFMDIMNILKAVLVGHSMGSFTATIAALRKPERVEMVISEDMFIKKIPQAILDPVIGYLHMWGGIVRNIPSHLNEKEAIKFAVDTLLSKMPKDSSTLSKTDSLYDIKFAFKRTPEGTYDVKYNTDVITRAARNCEKLTNDPEGQYDGPAYFIYGGLSTMQVGNEKEHIKQHFPRAEFIEFKDATHNVHVECPDKFKETLLECLRQ